MLFHCDVPTVWNIEMEEGFTVDPADADGLKDGHKKQTHPTGSIGIKQLEHIHSTLTMQENRTLEIKWGEKSFHNMYIFIDTFIDL